MRSATRRTLPTCAWTSGATGPQRYWRKSRTAAPAFRRANWRMSRADSSEAARQPRAAADSDSRSSIASSRTMAGHSPSTATLARARGFRSRFPSGRTVGRAMTEMSHPIASDGRRSRRILVVEDDRALATVLKIKLTMEGFAVECAADGNRASDAVRAFAPDLIVLDVTLPGTNGFELCRIWRESLRVPIIMLTARSDKADKLRGLTAGADDYMTKPFDTQELVARILAVLRRTRPLLIRLQLASVSIDFENARAQNAGKPIKLTRREFAMLRYLAERPNS